MAQPDTPRSVPSYLAGIIVGTVLWATLKAALATVPVWWLWMWLAPHLLAPELSLGQVFGALLLAALVGLVFRTETPGGAAWRE